MAPSVYLDLGGSSNQVDAMAPMRTVQGLLLVEMKSAELFWSFEEAVGTKKSTIKARAISHFIPEAVLWGEDGCLDNPRLHQTDW